MWHDACTCERMSVYTSFPSDFFRARWLRAERKRCPGDVEIETRSSRNRDGPRVNGVYIFSNVHRSINRLVFNNRDVSLRYSFRGIAKKRSARELVASLGSHVTIFAKVS